MGDGPRGIEVFPDHFQASMPGADSPQTPTVSTPLRNSYDNSFRSCSGSWTRSKLKSTVSMLRLLSLRRLPWVADTDGQEKVVLSAVEVASLRSEINDLEERESHLKAQLEHVDEILRSARLSGYLYMRMRWAALPGELPPLDDAEVDDWVPRFVVLHGSCLYLYMLSTDLSPQDSTMLSDIVEVGPLPCLTREGEEAQHCFYILTRQGLRYECSSTSRIQVDAWLASLQADCNLGSKSTPLNESGKPQPTSSQASNC
ncbi:PREDICTED: uncharacterized protein LOC109148141 isoform X2 [Ipomoea nil]|uniref:uncharacterized protein LOC109148141 isoform X2 n=2 Tax=Ipomoea nil TaxID=35883 RepID=UPI000901262A|nr:PREDICTED: uncharacterized protein LOC109148141 isoform X2 [Ipomoea nil]XP_019151494.1 PREDICTED: uncharacterized protein LOC109148141 isoform X2 [Ipomoea nil]